MISAQYISTDQRDGETVRWYSLTGDHAGIEFDGDVFGLCDRDRGPSVVLDEYGCAMEHGNVMTTIVLHTIVSAEVESRD